MNARREPIADPGTDEATAAALQTHLDHLNDLDPPTHDVPWFLANYRHPCRRARQSAGLAGKGVSTAIDLKERYSTLRDLETADDGEASDDSHAIIYREGRCKRCGETARSRQGRVVLTAERAPITGRVARGN